MNLNFPFKAPSDPAKFGKPIAFGVLVLINLGVAIIYTVVLRNWWVQAERGSQSRKRAIKGAN